MKTVWNVIKKILLAFGFVYTGFGGLCLIAITIVASIIVFIFGIHILWNILGIFM